MTPTVVTPCSKRLFNSCHPFDLFGVNACEDYISSVNRAVWRQAGCAFGATPNMKSCKILVTPLGTVRRMPMELHHLNDEGPGSNPGGSKMRGHSSMVEHEVSSKTC